MSSENYSTDVTEELLRATVARDCGEELSDIAPISGGKNNRIFRARSARWGDCVVKCYLSNRADTRDRLGAEFTAYAYLRQNGVECVPIALAALKDHNWGVYSFVQGEAWDRKTLEVDDIRHAANFVGELRRITKLDSAPYPHVASEACFDSEALFDNLAVRLGRLLSIDTESSSWHRAALQLVKRELVPFYERSKAAGHSNYTVEESSRILSPSDFGFHNAIREPRGAWCFLDFEYFGSDDPCKLLSDFVLHPGMRLSRELQRAFLSTVVERVPDFREILSRLRIVFPLYALKWCCIILNEFSPASAARRKFSGALQDGNRDAVLEVQLNKARWYFEEYCMGDSALREIT